MKPLLSIVIANYNYGRFLEAAIRSVLDQNEPEIELVVVDGGSTDNSVDVIRRYADRLGWWVSERDKGQSDAFNKGFAHCRGKYLTWLNADDIMPKGCLKKVCRELRAHPDCEWFTGNLFRFIDEDPSTSTQDFNSGVRRVVECAWGPNYLPKWLQSKGQPVAVYGPATFFTKELFDRVGGMKLEQNFMMDTDLWMRFIVAGVKQRRINCFCWAFRMHVDSKTAEFGEHKLSPEQRAKFEAERRRSMQETGYRASRLNLRLIQMWRMVDGSLIKCWWLRKTFKTVGL